MFTNPCRIPYALAMAGAVALAAVGAARAQSVAGVALPSSISPQGQELTLAGCGAKNTLWVDIYAVALYLPQPDRARETVFSPDTAKAVRLYPTYQGELPEEIPDQWSERLRRALPPHLFDEVQQFYSQVSTDDVGTIAYRPGQGTVMMVNDEAVRRVEGSRIMHGVLETWIGATPEGDNPIG
ncbi:MAG TPA: chalcone isomerase family protein [Arenibaculum sp.]|nr:chalcone isomerase family protein [Arenibaculum sp.]